MAEKEIDPEIERELLASQTALTKAQRGVETARARRQAAVQAAVDDKVSIYKIAKVLGVERPTVDSILKTAKKNK